MISEGKSKHMRRFIRSFMVIVGIALVASLLINLVVDPWRVTPTPLSSEAFEPYRDMTAAIRTGKCGLVRSAPEIGVALLGSSRVANSLDPLNPRWGRNDVYNLGGNACFIYENAAYFRYLLEKHSPELVILGIDPGDLSSDFDTRGVFDFSSSPLGPSRDALDREIRYLVGISTLEASFEAIKRRVSGETPQYDSRGLRRHRLENPMSQRAFLAAAIQGEAQFGFSEGEAFGEPIRADKFDLLRSILETSHDRNIRLVLLVHPQHALGHTRSAESPVPPYEGERRAITDLAAEINRSRPESIPTEVWDFGGYHPINCEVLSQEEGGRMNHWDDFNHYTLEIGDLMLARIMGWPVEVDGGEDYGVMLTPGNFDEWAGQARRDHRRYATGPGKADIEWARSLERGVQQ